jgi:hypothetical protein
MLLTRSEGVFTALYLKNHTVDGKRETNVIPNFYTMPTAMALQIMQMEWLPKDICYMELRIRRILFRIAKEAYARPERSQGAVI